MRHTSEFLSILINVILFRLYINALRQSAVDPDTGLVDVGILATGVAESSRQAATQLSQRIERLFIERDLRQIQTQKLYHDLRVEDKVCFTFFNFTFPIFRLLINICSERLFNSSSKRTRSIRRETRSYGSSNN
jgi:hypothetical protein